MARLTTSFEVDSSRGQAYYLNGRVVRKILIPKLNDEELRMAISTDPLYSSREGLGAQFIMPIGDGWQNEDRYMLKLEVEKNGKRKVIEYEGSAALHQRYWDAAEEGMEAEVLCVKHGRIYEFFFGLEIIGLKFPQDRKACNSRAA